MGDDWKPGDLALCVQSGEETRAGCIYTVREVFGIGWYRHGGMRFLNDEGVALDLYELPLVPGFVCDAARFRKINPLNEAERDAALRELNAPVREVV